MLKIPGKYTLDSLKNYIKKITLPPLEKITVSLVEEVSQDIKTIKSITKDLKEQKKAAEEPFETERKDAQIKLDAAKTGKQAAGQPYADTIEALAELENGMRQMILDFNKYQEDQRRIAEAEAAKLKAEEERLKAEAEAAAIKARRSGKEADAVAAFKAEQKAIKAEDKAATVMIPEIQKVSGVSTVKRVSYEVLDIMKVPQEYVEYVPDMVKIGNDVQAALSHMPFIRDIEYVVNPDLVPDNYMHDQVIHNRVLSDLRNGVEIPGIKKVFEEHAAVR